MKVSFKALILSIVICLTFTISSVAKEFSARSSAEDTSVNPFTGSASTSYPILVPQGRGGIQPNLSLVYDSSVGVGMFGVGWMMELGSIHRSTKNGKPNYDDTDTFILLQNGSTQELVNVPGTNRYMPKVEGSFMKIEKLSATDGRDAWKVTDRNGLVYEFGSNDDTRERDPNNLDNILKWNITKVSDVHGNYMDYTYFRDRERLYPETINYTKNDVASSPKDHHAQIVFHRGPRQNGEEAQSYIGGFRQALFRAVSEIEVYARGNLQRKYVFKYVRSDSSYRTLLQSIEQVGHDNASALPKTSFTYQTGEKGFQLDPGWTIPSATRMVEYDSNIFNNYKDLGVRAIDYNSDGYTDFIKAYSSSDNAGFSTEFYRNTKNKGWVHEPQNTTTGPILSLALPFVEHVTDSFYGNRDILMGYRFTDVDADGLIDIIHNHDNVDYGFFNDTFINSNVINRFWDIQSAATPSQEWITRETTHPVTGRKIMEQGGVGIADINGDGLPDYMRWNFKSQNDKDGVTYLNNYETDISSGWINSIQWSKPNDSNTDLTKGATFIDLNGDGLSEVYWNDASTVKIWMNHGAGWIDPNQPGIPRPWQSSKGLGQVIPGNKNETSAFVDLNGDGLVDVLTTKYDPSASVKRTSSALINSGNGWVENPEWGIPEGYLHTTARLLDANGDGLIDVLIHTQSTKNLYLNKGKAADVLVGVDNGVGGVTSIEYKPSSTIDNELLPFVTQVVSKVTVSDSRGSEYSTTYDYEGGLWNKHHKEFLGFRIVRQFDDDGNYTETEYYQGNNASIQKKGRVRTQTTFDSNNTPYAMTEFFYTVENIMEDVDFVYLDKKDNYVFDGSFTTGKRTQEIFEYNEATQRGNLTKSTQLGEVDFDTGADVGNDTRIIETDYINKDEADNYFLGLPSTTRIYGINEQSIAELKRQTWFYYDNQPLGEVANKAELTSKEDWAGVGEINPVTTYSYDEFGNLKTTVDPIGNATGLPDNHKTEITYDHLTNIFPVETKNARGHSVINEYYGVNETIPNETGLSGIWGQIKKTTDPNDETGLRSYDTFGRLVKTVSPLDSIEFPTTETEYTHFSNMVRVISKSRAKHNSAETIDSVSFSDALGRNIQTINPTAESGKYIISGKTVYDHRGQPIMQYLPFYSTNVSPSFEAIIENTEPNQKFTEVVYDAMGRALINYNLDRTFTSAEYKLWRNEAINENGHKQSSLFDAYGRLVKKIEHKGADGRADPLHPQSNFTDYSVTEYEYDSEGNLIKTISDAGSNPENRNITTTIEYDQLGRKKSMNDPDMGEWFYEYDLNGNLIEQTDAKGQVITFVYDNLNRLVSKSDSNNEINVTYTYDTDATPNTDNEKGRLVKADYLGGEASFQYDQIGREKSSTKIIGTTAYDVIRSYNALNAIDEVIYPDNQGNVHYHYNSIGQIDGVANDVTQFENIGPIAYFDKKQNTHITNPISVAQLMDTVNIFEVPNVYGQSSNSHLWFELEDFSASSPFQKYSDSSASNDEYVASPEGSGNSTSGPTSGVITIDFNVANSGNHYFWLRAKSANGGSNSIWLEIDGGSPIKWQFDENQPSNWVWNSEFSYTGLTHNLSAGNHTVKIFHREDGTKIDKLLITDDANYVPTGLGESQNPPAPFCGDGTINQAQEECDDGNNVDGDSCSATCLIEQSTPPDPNGDVYLFFEAESSNKPSPWQQASSSGVTYIHSSESAGNNTSSATVGAITFTVDVPRDDNYYILGRAITPDGGSNSIWLKFNNGSSANWQWSEYNSSWNWHRMQDYTNQPAQALGAGSNTITIHHREDGIKIDKFLVTTDATFVPNGADETTPGAPSEICGNGIVEGSEECDGALSMQCSELPEYNTGSVSCDANCNLDTTGCSYTPPASSGTVYNFWRQAENHDGIQSPVRVYNDSSASNNKGIEIPNGSGNYTDGFVKYDFDVALDDNYTIWVRTIATNNSDDSFFLSMDSSPEERWNIPQSSTWQWHRVKLYSQTEDLVLPLTTGEHTLRFDVREDGPKVDKILITNDLDFIPENEGGEGTEVIEDPNNPGENPDSQLFVRHVDYNIFGQVETIVFGNYVTTRREYDDNQRLSRVHTFHPVTGNIQDLNYSYDPAGNITTITNAINGDIKTFVYDELNRLVEATGKFVLNSDQVVTRQYEYDNTGNIIEKDGTTYVYGEGNAGPHAVTTTTTLDNVVTTYTYDANGNMATKQVIGSDIVRHFVYDPNNKLKHIFERDSQGADTDIAKYTYDGDGGRTITEIDGSTTIFFGSLYEIKDGIKTSHVFLGDTRIASMTQGEIRYFHTDHLGSLNITTTDTGEIDEEIEFAPFGKKSKYAKHGTGANVAQFYFTGQRYDGDSVGLHYYIARYYDADLGRFITPDTIVQDPSSSQTFNRYSYVGNNPVMHVDPSGHSFFKKILNILTGSFIGATIDLIKTGDWATFGRRMAVSLISAASGGLLSGIGTIASNAFLNVTAHAALGAGVGAVIGGLTSVIMGGSFSDGAKLGAIAGGVSGALRGYSTNSTGNTSETTNTETSSDNQTENVLEINDSKDVTITVRNAEEIPDFDASKGILIGKKNLLEPPDATTMAKQTGKLDVALSFTSDKRSGSTISLGVEISPDGVRKYIKPNYSSSSGGKSISVLWKSGNLTPKGTHMVGSVSPKAFHLKGFAGIRYPLDQSTGISASYGGGITTSMSTDLKAHSFGLKHVF